MCERRLFLLAFLESARNRYKKGIAWNEKISLLDVLFPTLVRRRTRKKRVAAAVIHLPTAAAMTFQKNLVSHFGFGE